MRPWRILDAFGCQGGAAVGYRRAGAEVVGVDNDHRHERYYPFEFHHGDAIAYIREHGHEFDAIHASPPCQAITRGNAGRDTDHVNLIPETRAALEATGRPYVIENVEDAGRHLIDPQRLCGAHFGLVTEDEDGLPLVLTRHRLFETNWPLVVPDHGDEKHRDLDGLYIAGIYNGARGRKRDKATGQWLQTAAEHRWSCRHERRGGYVPSDRDVWRRLLGIHWPTTVKALTEAIPPSYTHFIGRQLAAHLALTAATVRHATHTDQETHA